LGAGFKSHLKIVVKLLRLNHVSVVAVTGFELGVDDFIIAGQSGEAFMAGFLAGDADATLTQDGTDLVLRLDRGLTLTFDDTDLGDFVAEYNAFAIA
jgi:hypothetical protein